MKTAKFVVDVDYDPAVTDPESLAMALDTLMETVLSTPDILDDYGNPEIGEFFPVSEPSSVAAPIDPDLEAAIAIWGNPHALLENQKNEPVYLTNGCCENNVECLEELFPQLGLEWGYWDVGEGKYLTRVEGGQLLAESDGERPLDPYALTPREAQYIAEDGVMVCGYYAYLAYSALYLGKKWLAPCVEICFPEGDVLKTDDKPEFFHFLTQMDALAGARRYVDLMSRVLKLIGGHVHLFADEMPDRHTVMLLIPFEAAYRQGHYTDYKKWLETLTGGP